MDFRELEITNPILPIMDVWEKNGKVGLSFDTYLDYQIYSWLDKEGGIEYCNLNTIGDSYIHHRAFVTETGTPILSFSFTEDNSRDFEVMKIYGMGRNIVTRYSDYIEIEITSGKECGDKFRLPSESDRFFEFLEISFFNAL